MNSDVRELERLVKEEQYTIWQLCKHYNRNIHVSFFRFLNGLYSNKEDAASIKAIIVKNSYSVKKKVKFSKEYLEKELDSGITIDELAEENGYINSFNLFKYIKELYDNNDELYKAVMDKLKSNAQKGAKSNGSAKPKDIEKNIAPNKTNVIKKDKLVILLASDFIERLDANGLVDYINNNYSDMDVEFRVLRFTIEKILGRKDAYSIINKLYLLPNMKFIDFSTSYSYDISSSSKYKMETYYKFSISNTTFDNKEQINFYLIDNDVIIQYLAQHIEENIIVATHEKSLIVSCKKIGKYTLNLYNGQYFVTDEKMFDISNTDSIIVIDTNIIYKVINMVKYASVTLEGILPEGVIYEMLPEHFLQLLYQSKTNRNIIFDVHNSLVNRDFIYNDIAILVDSILKMKKFGDTKFISNDQILCIEAKFSGLSTQLLSNLIKPNNTSDDSDIIEEISDTPKSNDISSIDTHAKIIPIKESGVNNVLQFKTLKFSIVGGMATVSDNSIEAVYKKSGAHVSKTRISSKKYVYKIAVGYFIKFKNEDKLYTLINLTKSNNLKKTHLTLEDINKKICNN